MTTRFIATDIHKTFDGTAHVLQDINLTAEAGTLTVIRGAQGSGRSTLIRCLTGGYRINYGGVEIMLPTGSIALSHTDPRALAWAREQYLSIFDGALATPPSQSCVNVVQRIANGSQAAAYEALERVGMVDRADLPIGRLRMPARKTVALAAALLAPAPVVILDTPEAVAPADSIAEWVDELTAQGKIVIATADQTSTLQDLAHHTATLTEGTLQWN